MIDKILKLVTEYFPVSQSGTPNTRWEEMSDKISKELEIVFSNLCEHLPVDLPKTFNAENKKENLYIEDPSLTISFIKIRPNNEYYTEFSTLSVPLPENPGGKTAAGLSIIVSVIRAYKQGNTITPPEFSLELEVWGAKERNCFKNLYQDHRYLLSQFLAVNRFEIQTSSWFKDLENYKGNDITRKLDLYFKENDGENQITIKRSYLFSQNVDDIISAFTSIICIYHSLRGYCSKTPEKDRLIALYPTVCKDFANNC